MINTIFEYAVLAGILYGFYRVYKFIKARGEARDRGEDV